MKSLLFIPVLLSVAACSAESSTAQAPATTQASALNTEENNPAKATAEDSAYTQKISERSAAIVKALALTNEALAPQVQAILMKQYRALHDWQEAHEAEMKALKKASHNPDAASAAKAKEGLTLLLGTRKALRTQFLSALAELLTSEQIEIVKDRMTYNKVQVTFNAYCAQNPWLKEAQKAKIRSWLIEAREEAIDGGSSEEKSDIFNQFKGRINNYLVKEKKSL